MNNNYFNPNMFNPNMPYTNGLYPHRINQVYIKPPKLIGALKNNPFPSKISFTNILNGTSKTLGVINQAIPVMYQIKPIWKNAKTMLKVAKEINKPDLTKEIKKEEKIKKETTKKEKRSNQPTFFL